MAKETLTNTFRALILRHEKLEYVLNTPISAQPAVGCTAHEVTMYNKHKEHELDVQSFLVKKFKVTKSPLSHKMTEGSSLDTHMLRMTSDVEQLEKLNSPLSKEFVTDVILNSLPPSYSNFIRNYYMLGMDKSLQELKGMLRIADGDMKKSSSILVIQEGARKIKKMKRKATPKMAPKYKGKGKMVPNQNTSKAKASTSDCFYCQGNSHWRRNCPKYLEDLRTGKVPKVSTSGIFMIEVNVVTSIYDWVLDTGSCAHICSNIQALKNRRKLRNKEVQLRVGNGAQVAAVTVGSIELYLPSGLVMELENVYFVPNIFRNIISISCLEMNGFSFVIKDNGCSIYKDELYYGSSFMMNDLYILEIDKPIFNINKRLKTSHESMTFIWHYRLGHINEKRIKSYMKLDFLIILIL